MDPKLLELLMKAGEFSGREDVPEDVKELLGQLVQAAATGSAPSSDDAPPAAEADAAPASEEEKPPAMTDEEEKPPAPAPRAEIAAKLAKSKRDAEAAEAASAKALRLAESRLRSELFASAPDVFPVALPKTREPYASAKPEEIERFIASTRARTAPPAASPADKGPKGRADIAPPRPSEPREPAPGDAPPANPGGMTVIIGGKRVA